MPLGRQSQLSAMHILTELLGCALTAAVSEYSGNIVENSQIFTGGYNICPPITLRRTMGKKAIPQFSYKVAVFAQIFTVAIPNAAHNFNCQTTLGN